MSGFVCERCKRESQVSFVCRECHRSVCNRCIVLRDMTQLCKDCNNRLKDGVEVNEPAMA